MAPAQDTCRRLLGITGGKERMRVLMAGHVAAARAACLGAAHADKAAASAQSLSRGGGSARPGTDALIATARTMGCVLRVPRPPAARTPVRCPLRWKPPQNVAPGSRRCPPQNKETGAGA
ncbi:hypothetical protein AL035_02560 [Salipiger aestuarii]|nr:hypothetical protein AL035_02560 [Salipiger aestuarii]